MKKPNFIIATFITKDTPYEKVFQKYFLPSAMNLKYKYGVDWKVITIDNLKSWSKNVAQKPKVILDILNTLLETNDTRNLVFLDADSVINGYPDLFDDLNNVDLAFHRLDWNTWYRNNRDRKELLTGTMFFNNVHKVRELCQEWYDRCLKTDLWEQKVLEELLEEKNNLTIYELPVEYCYIDSLPNGEKPYVQCNPVITHYQVSRQLKRSISL